MKNLRTWVRIIDEKMTLEEIDSLLLSNDLTEDETKMIIEDGMKIALAEFLVGVIGYNLEGKI